MKVKVLKASINNRRREFEIELTDRGVLTFPYHRAEPPPTRDDLIREFFIDPELGNEGVTYVLESGAAFWIQPTTRRPSIRCLSFSMCWMPRWK